MSERQELTNILSAARNALQAFKPAIAMNYIGADPGETHLRLLNIEADLRRVIADCEIDLEKIGIFFP